jgi:transcriptional regulator with XRE-family HTH domain
VFTLPSHKTKPKGRAKPSGRRGKGQAAEATAAARRQPAGLTPKSKLLPVAANELVARVRQAYGLGRKLFAKMTGFSERAISGWERGATITEPGLRKMREMDHLRQALAEVMQPDFIPEWLTTPNEEFQGATPIEVIERGETGRIWRFIYYLESGMPV